jgi:hypothetical protein
VSPLELRFPLQFPLRILASQEFHELMDITSQVPRRKFMPKEHRAATAVSQAVQTVLKLARVWLQACTATDVTQK